MVSTLIGNDPNRGYTFDMDFDTRHPMDMLDIVHGCVEGALACLTVLHFMNSFECEVISCDIMFTFVW